MYRNLANTADTCATGVHALALPANRIRRVLHHGTLAVLLAILAGFVSTYPLLRLGYVGPVPEGYAMEAALGMICALLGAALCLLEGGRAS